MIIQHNLLSANTNRQLGISTKKKTKSMEKLSSGYRINRAADNAAGLSISEKMRAQIKGLGQASDNAQDGISLIQVADGGLDEVQSILHRMRELSVSAANDTNVTSDRLAIQEEMDALGKEIERIGTDTEFNTKKLLDGSCSSSGLNQSEKNKFISWLNGSWLNDAAEVIENATGWKLESGSELNVTFTKSNNNYIATMTGWYLGDEFTLDINTKYLIDGLPYNGTDGPTIGGIAADRVITHEILHEYMFDNVSPAASPDNWFIEGLAEAVNGASNTRYASYELYGDTDYALINDRIQAFDFLGNQGGDETYTVGYLAASYLHQQVESAGAGNFNNMLDEMKESDETFQQLVAKYTMVSSYNDFIENFKKAAQSAMDANQFTTDFLEAQCGIDITDSLADPIGVADANSSDVIPNYGSAVMPGASTTTLSVGSTLLLTVHWDSDVTPKGITLQIGANNDQSMVVSIDEISKNALGLSDISVSSHTNASMAVRSCDDAIQTVSAMRSNLGAYQNRLEHVIYNLDNSAENIQAAESLIRDTDIPKEMMELSKMNILEQAGQAILTQANQSSQGILALLK